MNSCTIYCTEELTKKALELGAPIELYSEEYNNSNRKNNGLYVVNDIISGSDEEFVLICIIDEKPNRKAYFVPTAEQMISWLEDGLLEEVHVEQDIDGMWSYIIYGNGNELIGISNLYPCMPEATLAAIDAALEYLSSNKK